MKKLFFLIPLLLACGNRDYRISKAREFIGRWDYARALIELSSFKNKKDAEAQYLLGRCAVGQNNYEEARRYMQSAIETDTAYIDSVDQVYKSLIQKSIQVNDPARAGFFFDQLLSLSPRLYFEPTFLFLMGDIYYDGQDYGKAASTYEKALKIDSTSRTAKDAMNRLIDAYEKSNNLQKAVALVELRYAKTKSSLLLVRMGKYYFDIGTAHFEKKILDTAQIYFTRVIESGAAQSLVDDAYFYLGEISLANGNPADARGYYEKVLKLNPYRKGPLVEKAKQRLEEIKGKG